MFWEGLWLKLNKRPSTFSGLTSTWMLWYVKCCNQNALHYIERVWKQRFCRLCGALELEEICFMSSEEFQISFI